MADLTQRGKPADGRQREINRRRLQHQIHALRVTMEKYEIDILEAEQNIGRTRESIRVTEERVEEFERELQKLEVEV